MKIGTWILTISLAASAWAQSAGPSTPTTGAPGTPKPQAVSKPQSAPKAQAAGKQQSAAKPSASLPAKSAPAAAKSPAAAAKSATPAAPAAKNEKSAAKSATPAAPAAKNEKSAAAAAEPAKPGKQSDKQAKAESKEPGKAVAQKSSVHQGRRDPFVNPIVERTNALCTGTGKRCLYIGDLSLIGIVESSNGVIAVVASGRHTYFLRENDPLADGEVERISGDAITLRQRTSDLLGRPVVREVTRKIGMPAV
jgi:hypothetical protein